MSIVLTTESLDQKERFNYWNDVVTKFYAPCVGNVAELDQFNATTTVHSFGSSEISTVDSVSIRYDRRPEDLHRIPREDIFLSVITEGEGYFSQNDRTVKHQKGDVLLYDSAKPYVFNYPKAYQSMLLRVPRALVQTKVNQLDQLGGTVFKSHTPHARLIQSLMRETNFIASEPELQEGDEFIMPTLEMITTALGKATNSQLILANETSHQKLLNEIKQFARQNITEESLSLEMIAEHKNLSIRTLSRLFAEAGETPKSWLQEQRLCGAYEAILKRRVTNVTEAALTFGYKDLSHFSRAFKRRFGCTPNSLLH